MTKPLQVTAMVGSLRRDSFNRSVLKAIIDMAPDGAEISEVSLADVPLYNGDVEAEGDPEAVAEMKRLVDQSDGLIIVTPEYNRSIPAVTKNAVDWLSRTPGQSVLSRTTVGIVAASPGGHAAGGVRDHLSVAVSANTKRFYETTHGIASIANHLTDGSLSSPDIRDDLQAWLAGFIDYAKEHQND